MLYAQTKGAVVVTAPGNSQMNIDQLVLFPPYADDPLYTDAEPRAPTNVLVAAAVDGAGNLTSVSSWGPAHVDLGAPFERARGSHLTPRATPRASPG